MTILTCYHCGKIIKGKYVGTNPPIHLIRLGVDFPKAFHPTCYAKAETKASKELRGNSIKPSAKRRAVTHTPAAYRKYVAAMLKKGITKKTAPRKNPVKKIEFPFLVEAAVFADKPVWRKIGRFCIALYAKQYAVAYQKQYNGLTRVTKL